MTKEEKIFEAIGEISEKRLAESEEEADSDNEKKSEKEIRSEIVNESQTGTEPQKKITKFRKHSDTMEKLVCACAVLCLLIVAGRRFLPGLLGSNSSSSPVATEAAVDYDSALPEAEMNEASGEKSEIAEDGSSQGEYLCSIDPEEAAMISVSGGGETVQITTLKQVQKYVEAWNSVEIDALDESAIAEGTYIVTIYDDGGNELYKFAMDSAEGSAAYTVVSGDLCFEKIETMLQ